MTLPPSDALVSVIVPAWNAADWIEPAVRSALDQTWRSLEVIVADDGSTDSTITVLQRLALEEPRLRIVEGSHSGHPGIVRNRALLAARGELIAFLDADDLWVATKLEDQIAALRLQPGAEVCVTSARLFLPDEPIPSLQRSLPPEAASPALRPPESPPPLAYAALLTRRRTIHTSTLLITRSLLERIGPFSELPRLCSGQDDDFIFRAWKNATPVVLPPVYVFARRRPESVSSGNAWQNVFALLEAAEERGDLPASVAQKAWSAAWIVRAERSLHDPGAPWRSAMIQAWRLDPLNFRRLPALFSVLLPRAWARPLYARLRRAFLPGPH